MPTNQYSHTTRAQAEAILGLRLLDPGQVRFPAAELDVYMIEAIRTFNALTGIYQDTDIIAALAPGTAFVDLPAAFPAMRGYTVLDSDLVTAIGYHLIDGPNSFIGGWSEMFNGASTMIVQALQRRRDQFLLETGCRITRHAPIPAAPAVITPGSGEFSIDQSVIDIRRAAWTTPDGKTTPLWTTSNWSLRGFSPSWNLSPDLPLTYAYNQRSPGVLQLGPPPASSGTVDLLTVDAGAALTGAGALLGIPDDFAPFIKWGAMADLLSQDGPMRDYPRALFCERRYQIGVAAAEVAAVLIDARFNDQIVQFSTLPSLDASPEMQYWQSRTGTPAILAPAGLNMVAIAPPPASATSLELTIVTNAPVPASLADQLQIPLEYLDTVLGYAQHLAAFRTGGKELAATTYLADGFFAAAMQYNARLAAVSVFEDDQRVFSQLHESVKPRRVRREAVASGSGPQPTQGGS